jgi:hypothetical protein
MLTRLDYLEHLGVDVVWLCSVYRSPMDDNGYDISDYQDVEPLFGTLDDLDKLITGLHSRDMKLVMDMVVNHTSDEHPPWRGGARSLYPSGGSAGLDERADLTGLAHRVRAGRPLEGRRQGRRRFPGVSQSLRR